MDFPDVMVDLETTGTRPETTNIIQISAVKFNLATGDVDMNFFDRCLIPLPTRFWSEDTREWWSKMPELLDGIYARMEPAKTVMQDFSNWAYNCEHLWAKPIHFEWPFLQSYFNELEVHNPFHYRYANDQNTFIRSRFFPEEAPPIEKELEFQGEEHNALHDVLHQVKVVMAAYKRTT